jgi:hypothetical protein
MMSDLLAKIMTRPLTASNTEKTRNTICNARKGGRDMGVTSLGLDQKIIWLGRCKVSSGEVPFCELLRALKRGRDFDRMCGLSFRNGESEALFSLVRNAPGLPETQDQPNRCVGAAIWRYYALTDSHAERRAKQDQNLVADMARDISRLFPGCPPAEARTIAEHTAQRAADESGARLRAGRWKKKR